LIAEAIDLIVFIAGRDGARKVETIARLEGGDADGYRLTPVVASGSFMPSAPPSPVTPSPSRSEGSS
jgi:type IV secretion system protein VirB11